MIRKKSLVALLLLCSILLSALPATAATSGRSFTAKELYPMNKPLAEMPNTFEAWLYFPATMDAAKRGGVIMGNYYEGSRETISFEIYSNGNPRLYYTESSGKATSLIFRKANVYSGAWTHVAIVRDPAAGVAHCYLNGQLVETAALTVSDFVPADALVLGGDYRNGNGQYFKGQLRSVAVYAESRSREQIQADQNTFGGGFPLAAWDVSTSANSYTDLSGNGHDVALSSIGRTFRADQVNYVCKEFPAVPNTVEAWVYFPADTPAATRGGVILGSYNDGAKGLLSFEIYTGGKPRMYYIDAEGVVTNKIFSSVNVYTGKWTHVAIVRDATAGMLHCYVDGVLAESQPATVADYVPSKSLVLGGDRRSGNSQYFKGQLRSVALYSDARTQAEIQGDMSTLNNGDPLAVWDTRATASSHYDRSGNDYHINLSPVGLSFLANETYEVSKPFSTLPKTVEAWVHFPTSTPSTNRGGVILGNYHGGGRKLFSFEIYNNGKPRIYFVDGNGTVTDKLFSNVNVYTGQWTHVAVTIDSSAGKADCYINGALAQSIQLTVPNFVPEKALMVGGDPRSGNAQYFKGQIRSVSVFSQIRSADEIMNDRYTLGKSDALAAWDLSKSANSYTDLSGNAYHLNLDSTWIKEKEPVSGYDYTFAVVGDTQVVTYKDSLNGTKNLNKIYDWIVSQKDAQNIQYVMGLGDITERQTVDGEWTLALNAINKLNGVVPYSLVRGNHDNAGKMNEYFGDPSKSPYSSSYEGSYKGSVVNTWRTITVGKNQIPYLILCLDFGMPDDVLAWADQIITEHPHHNVIITTHAYMYRDGTTLDSGDVCPPSIYSANLNNGDQVWEKFIKKHQNISLVLSGHDPSAQIAVAQERGTYGNVITQMLIDPQGVDTSVLTGAVALFHFSEDGRKLSVEYYSTIQERYFMSSNQFELDVHVVEPVLDQSITMGHSLNLASDISVNYVIPASQLEQYDSFFLDCEVPSYEGSELNSNVIHRLQPELKGDRYYFTMRGLFATQMNDVLHATLHMSKDGIEYISTTDSYSIATYAYNQLNKEGSADSLRKLCSDLLRYGTAAQIWKGYRLDHLASANMTEAHKSYLTDLNSVRFNSNKDTLKDLTDPTITWYGKALSLENKVVIRFVFNTAKYTGSISDLTLRISYKDASGKTITQVLTEAEKYSAGSSYYAFDVDVLTAAQMRTVVSAAVYAKGVRLSQTTQYSIDTYGNNKSGTLLTLCQAMVAYGDSAAAYFK